MDAVVEGEIAPLTELEHITDWAAVKKVVRRFFKALHQTYPSQHFKLNQELAIKNADKNVARERAIVDKIVVSSVAMKSIAT